MKQLVSQFDVKQFSREMYWLFNKIVYPIIVFGRDCIHKLPKNKPRYGMNIYANGSNKEVGMSKKLCIALAQ